MTDIQNAYFQMFSATKHTCTTHSSEWSATPVFADQYNLFVTDIMDNLATAIAAQMEKATGITHAKMSERTKLAQKLEQTTNGIVAYALTTGNAALRAEANLPAYKIARAADDVLLGLVTRMVTIANAHIAALAPFGVTPATIADIEATATTFAGFIGKPRATIHERRIATENLAALFSRGANMLRKMDDLMILFKASAPDFYAAWFHSRKLIKRGFRTRSLWVRVKDTQGNELADATFSVPTLQMKKKTSANGICRADHAPQGTYEATIRKEGYASQTASFIIVKGEATRLEIVLDRA